jgi:uncharacterized membrane protein
MVFIYLHVAWFSLWVLLNTGRFGVHAFDPFPYGLLTMVVSLEAIFLSALVLITQNRLTAEVERRADLDLHIGLLTEHELTRVERERLLGPDFDLPHEFVNLDALGAGLVLGDVDARRPAPAVDQRLVERRALVHQVERRLPGGCRQRHGPADGGREHEGGRGAHDPRPIHWAPSV